MPARHPLRAAYIFTHDSLLHTLRAQLNLSNRSWTRPTGIPPFVKLYQQQISTQQAVERLPSVLFEGFSKMLDEKGISSNGITRRDLTDCVRALLVDAGLCKSIPAPATNSPSESRTNDVHLWPRDGKFHSLPETFKFPLVDALGAWRPWWFGNSSERHPQYRALQPSDFATKEARSTYSEWTVLVRHLTDAIERVNGCKMTRPKDVQEADSLFRIGSDNVPMKKSSSATERRPNRAATTLRRIREAIREPNPSARVVRFRKRKRKKQKKQK